MKFKDECSWNEFETREGQQEDKSTGSMGNVTEEKVRKLWFPACLCDAVNCVVVMVSAGKTCCTIMLMCWSRF